MWREICLLFVVHWLKQTCISVCSKCQFYWVQFSFIYTASTIITEKSKSPNDPCEQALGDSGEKKVDCLQLQTFLDQNGINEVIQSGL